MSLSPEQIRQVAHLARLSLADDKVDHYARQLSNIMEMVGRLANAQTDGVGPMAHPLEMTQRLRPDAISETDRREVYQAVAPQVQDGLYLVPKVID